MQSRFKGKHLTIKIDLTGFICHVWITGCPIHEFRNGYFLKLFPDYGVFSTAHSALASCLSNFDAYPGEAHLFIPHVTKATNNLAILAHEVSHLADMFVEYHGFTDYEVKAYTIQYLTNEILCSRYLHTGRKTCSSST